ncbi:glycosyltransferase [Alteribacter lacisalsi]|nr:glycosyltransferase [Alteribacter lacisalsi]
MNEQVTVILATYNAEKYLESCLSSISRQTLRKFRVHIIDDGSSDGTVRILKQWTEKDSRFRLIRVHRHNRGLTSTLNELLDTCKTSYTARMDADDLMHPGRLKKQVRYLNNHPECSILGSHAIDIDEDENIRQHRDVPTDPEKIGSVMPFANPLVHPTVMMRTRDIIHLGGYNETYRNVQDYELWFRAQSEGLHVHNLRDPLLYYRVVPGHGAKRGLRYRMLDARIRWHGTKRLGLGLPVRAASVSVALCLGLMPGFLKPMLVSIRSKVDPRHSRKKVKVIAGKEAGKTAKEAHIK